MTAETRLLGTEGVDIEEDTCDNTHSAKKVTGSRGFIAGIMRTGVVILNEWKRSFTKRSSDAAAKTMLKWMSPRSKLEFAKIEGTYLSLFSGYN